MSDTFSKVEVITGVARRRRFSTDMKLAVVAEQSGKKKDTLDAYRRVRDEFVSRHLPPASEAAAAAAKAEFLLTEEKFAAFKAKPLKFTATRSR